MKEVLPAAALAVALLAAAPPARAAATDPFYLDLLRDGIHAYDRGEFASAARSLRFACFGMLDEPKPLAACLTRLALAQDRATDVAGFRQTFTRLVEIEERFQGYSQADLPPELRTALEQRLVAHIPAATLASSPAVFRTQAARKPAAAAPATPQTQAPQPAPGKAVKQAPKDTPQPISAPPVKAVAVPPGPQPLTAEERTKLETSRKLLAETGKAKQLEQAFQLAREVADAHPESIEATRLAGEAAYRVSRWSDVVIYLQRGGGLPDSEPELLFYLAVSLYESGDHPAAAAVLRRALPNLQRSPYIEAYGRKILGQ
jgi:tetratricopeptide (TPR) repeat protein